MLTKLTLSIEKSVIEQAKEHALSKNTSVSKLVSQYLQTISASQPARFDTTELNAPKTKQLAGMFQADDDGSDYKDMLEAALLEKHI